jgi:hypothetical protein
MINKEFLTYRIMKGHLSFRRGGLSLFILEPDPDMMYRSTEIYEDIFDHAYGEGVLLKDESLEILYEKELYSPFEDKQIENLKKDIENLKLECFKNFHNSKSLNGLKYLLRTTEKQLGKLYRQKSQLDHLTCEGIASVGQWNWIIENSTYYKDTNEPYGWKEISINSVMSYYEESIITSEDFRAIAKSDTWRPIWNLGKKTGNLFNKPSTLLTRDQLTLCSFSQMYDNVYESQESPPEKVIEDDDCLDGWFIQQRKKHEQFKKEQEANSLVSTNPKIAKAGEVFVIAESDEVAEYVDSLNTHQARNIKNQRLDLVRSQGQVKDMDFLDVQLDLQNQQTQALFSQSKGR